MGQTTTDKTPERKSQPIQDNNAENNQSSHSKINDETAANLSPQAHGEVQVTEKKKEEPDPLLAGTVVEETDRCPFPRVEGAETRSTHDIQSEAKKEEIRLKNPKYQSRSDRIDLISHGIHHLTTKLGSHAYALCDISPWGFSYAQQLPLPKGLSFRTMRHKLRVKLDTVVGSHLPFTIFDQKGEEHKAITVNGWVRNFRYFFGLPLQAVEKEVKQYLYKRGYSEIRDPYDFFAKGNMLIDHAKKIKDIGGWDIHAQISLNISMMQFLEELGATDQFFEDLWLTYEQHPLFAKFGVYVEVGEEAQGLLGLAGINEKLGEPHPLPKLPRTQKQLAASENILQRLKKHGNPLIHPPKQVAKNTLIYAKANKVYSSGPLLTTAWRGLMHLYHIDENTPFPNIAEGKLKHELDAELHLPLEHLFDANEHATQLTINRIMAFELAHLIEKTSGMKPPPISNIMLKVLLVKAKVFSIAIKKLETTSL